MKNKNENCVLSASWKVCHDREATLLADLRGLLNSPPSTRKSLLVVVDQLLINLSRQFELASRSGFLTEVTELRPGWHREVQALQVANLDCITSLREIRDRITSSTSSSRLQISEGQMIDAWVRSLVSNRYHESRLLQAAFSLDIGGEA